MTATRYHGLDALRAVAMVLGVVLHSALVYLEPDIMAMVLPGTDVQPEPPMAATSILMFWIHIWRMPAFFLLAGFFSQMVLQQKGANWFLRDRSVRILGTFVVFLFLFNLLAGGSWGRMDHLWFLWFLIWYSAIALVLDCGSFGEVLRPALWFFDRTWRLMLLIVPTILLVWGLKEDALGHRIPGQPGSGAAWHGFLYYYAFFAFGQALWFRRERIGDIKRPWVWGGLLGLGTVGLITLLGLVQAEAKLNWKIIPAGAATFGWTLGLIGMAEFVIRGPARWIRTGVRLAYPVYLFHLYPAVAYSALLVGAGLPQWVAMPINWLLTLATSVLLYLVFVRFTPLDWLLAGYEKSWFKWPFARNLKPSA